MRCSYHDFPKREVEKKPDMDFVRFFIDFDTRRHAILRFHYGQRTTSHDDLNVIQIPCNTIQKRRLELILRFGALEI